MIGKEEFRNIITNIKEEIKTTQVKTMLEVNKNLIMLYFRLGKIIHDNSEYGNSFIKKCSDGNKIKFSKLKGVFRKKLKKYEAFFMRNMKMMRFDNILLSNCLGGIIYYL